MGSHGIKDQVAIVGMGCTRFGEHWDSGADDLLVEAVNGRPQVAGIDTDVGRRATGSGTPMSGVSGMTLSKPARLTGKPVVRVENMCATGSEALARRLRRRQRRLRRRRRRSASRSSRTRASQGLNAFPIPNDGTAGTLDRGRHFSMAGAAYAKKYGVDPAEMKTCARRDRLEEPRQRRAQRAGAVPQGGLRRRDLAMPTVAPASSRCWTAPGWPTAPPPRSSCGPKTPTDTPTIRSTSRRSRWWPATAEAYVDPAYDYTTFPESCRLCPRGLRRGQASSTPAASSRWPRSTTASPSPSSSSARTSASPSAARPGRTSSSGAFALDGDLPVNPDGGLEGFGHPVGASGLRMIFECWLQLRGEAGDRQLDTERGLALTHNLGGYPGEMVSCITVLGDHLG